MALLFLLFVLGLAVSVEGRTWHTFNGSQYSIETTPVTSYVEAKGNCSLLQANVANVKTEPIFNFLKKHINLTDFPNSLFIGARILKDNGTFQWTDGSEVSVPRSMRKKGQSNNVYERCMTMGHHDNSIKTKSYEFYEVRCAGHSARYICEKIAENTTNTRTVPGDILKPTTKATTPTPTTTTTTTPTPTTTTATTPTPTTTTTTTPTTTTTIIPTPTTTTTIIRTTTISIMQQSTITTTTTTTIPKIITHSTGKTANEDKTIASTTILKSTVETEPAPITVSSPIHHNTLSGSTTESNSTIIIVSAVGSCVTIIVICIVSAFVIAKIRRNKRLRQPTELDEMGNVFETAAGFEPDETYGNPVLTSFHVQEQPVTPSAAQENNPDSMASDLTAANEPEVETNGDQSLEKQNEPYSLASDLTPATKDMYSVVNKKQQATSADQSHLVTVAAEIYSTPHHLRDSHDVTRDNGKPKAQDELENTGDSANAYGHLDIGQSDSDNPYDVLST